MKVTFIFSDKTGARLIIVTVMIARTKTGVYIPCVPGIVAFINEVVELQFF